MAKKKESLQKKKTKNWFRRMADIFVKGDCFTKLSFLILGLSNLVRGQIVKGISFLATEIIFIYFMVTYGVERLVGIITLGTVETQVKLNDRGRKVQIMGDNSMKFLLFGVAVIFVVMAFFIVWQGCVKAAYDAQVCKEKGLKLNNFIEDIKEYFDNKLHKTLLFFPSIGIVLFTVVPLVFMILIAFTNYNADHPVPKFLFDWVGLDNFKQVLGSSSKVGSTFWTLLSWTFVWAIFATFLNYLLGMLLALLINRKTTRFKGLWRTIFVLSIAIPQFVSLLIMRNMFGANGPINVGLQNLGWIGAGARDVLPFFTNATWAKVTIILINLWIGIPYTMLITTGILQNIPSDLYESARVDGANAPIIFRKITLPYMIFVTTPYLITQFIGNINNFNVIFLLSGGGPENMDLYNAGSTDLLVTWLYKLTVDKSDFAYASVIGILVFIICATLSLITYRRSGSYNNEEGFQ